MFLKPGITAAVETTESAILTRCFFGDPVETAATIVSTTVDAGSTPTTTLRPGLVLGRITSTGKYTQHNPDATDGSQFAVAVLTRGVSMLDANGTAADKTVSIADGGCLIASGMISGSGDGALTQIARAQLAQTGKFTFNDDPNNKPALPLFGGMRVVNKSADYTVTSADNGTVFMTGGATAAVNFTMPAIVSGLAYLFINSSNQNMTVTSAAGNDIVTFNDAAASSISFQTANEKLGGTVLMHSTISTVADTPQWNGTILGPNTPTVA